MPREVQLRLVANFREALGEDSAVASFSIGPTGEAMVLAVANADAREPFVEETRADRTYDGTVLIHSGGWIERIDLRGLDTTFPILQPLPDNELLVVGTRCERRPDGTYDRNGRVFGADGSLKREFLLGDGIADVQTTKEGRIWVSYFDEGVFGNYGWGEPGGPEPIGAAGLLRFDSNGNREWEYKPPRSFEHIADCYALNVAHDATWAYYYTHFPLVRVASDNSIEAWRTPVDGASAFALDRSKIIFYGGYADERDRCLLAEFSVSRGIRNIAPIRLALPGDVQLKSDRIIGRRSTLHALADNVWYQIDVREL